MTQRQCEIEVLLQLIAGTDSTSNAIRNTMLSLVSTPRAYRRLQQEIEEGIAAGNISSPITFAQGKAMPYLQVRSVKKPDTNTFSLKLKLTTASRPSSTRVCACFLPHSAIFPRSSPRQVIPWLDNSCQAVPTSPSTSPLSCKMSRPLASTLRCSSPSALSRHHLRSVATWSEWLSTTSATVGTCAPATSLLKWSSARSLSR